MKIKPILWISGGLQFTVIAWEWGADWHATVIDFHCTESSALC